MRWPATEPAAVRWCGFRTRSFFTIPSADPPPRPSPARGERDLGPPTRPSPTRGKGHAGGGSIGIMGGTHDPVHNRHLAAARQLRDEAALEQVWLVPNAYPPHRSAAPVASAEDRLRMVQLAVSDQPGSLASQMEGERGGISYTTDTAVELA